MKACLCTQQDFMFPDVMIKCEKCLEGPVEVLLHVK